MIFWPIATAALTAFHVTTAQPGNAVALHSNIFVERTSVGADGHERRVLASPSKLGEGDAVIFLVRYRNISTAPVSNVALVSPVPRGIRIESDRPDLLVSVDGGARWGRLSDLNLRTPLGGTRRAVAEDITHIRWSPRAPIAPGEAGQLSYRGTVRQ